MNSTTLFKSIFKAIYRVSSSIFTLILILAGTIIFYLNLNESIAKTIDTYIAPLFSKMSFNWLSQKTSISLLELSSYLMVFMLLVFIYLFARKKYESTWRLSKMAILLTILFINWFYLTWGYRYYIPPTIGDIGNFKPSIEDIHQLHHQVGLALKKFTSRPKEEPLATFLPKLSQTLETYLASEKYTYSSSAKSSLQVKSFSIIPYSMKIFGVAGVYNPWYGEVHVNEKLPFGFQIFTLIHELSHKYGITSEYQANVIAYEVCRELYSHDVVCYSLLLNLTLYLLPYLTFAEQQIFLNNTLPSFVKEDLLEYYAYWQHVFIPVTRLNRWIYDIFLKSNNIEDGTQSYGQFISYIIHQGNFSLEKIP